MAPTTTIPITLVTGFLGSGKTTLLLNLLPQLREQNPDYKVALLKNEFGDLAIDSQLAASSSISGVREMLNGCICCNLVGDIGPALAELRQSIPDLDRVVIETSGSAFPATLAMEINRLARETGGLYVLDGVVTVIDVENVNPPSLKRSTANANVYKWKGYEDTSYTAKLQARYTDLIVFNKWEKCDERRFDDCLDRLGDLEGVQVAWVKSDMGKVPFGLVFGVDESLARALDERINVHDHGANGHAHDHEQGHQSEVEVLSVTLRAENQSKDTVVDTSELEKLLKVAPKDEIYRIKAIITASEPIPGSDEGVTSKNTSTDHSRYILNWAFGRWTCTPMAANEEHASSDGILLRMTVILARYESTKWKRKIETGGYIKLVGEYEGALQVDKIL
jgi:G3E family GTPase